jgi:biofilm PGA synthesis N-glycosyltransferase PgaC
VERAAREKRAIDRITKGIVAGVRAGVAEADSLDYKYLAKMDADVTLEPAFFEKVLARMEEDPRLGLAGGGIYNVGAPGGFLKPEFVGGPVRVFRKECWDAIGGLLPVGHEDATSVASAQMKGWRVRCFPEIKAYQHDVPGNTYREKIPVCFHLGKMDYIMGGLFGFELARSAARMLKPPFLLAGSSMLLGYLWAWAKREPIEVPRDIVEFMREDQRRKLRGRFQRRPGSRTRRIAPIP